MLILNNKKEARKERKRGREKTESSNVLVSLLVECVVSYQACTILIAIDIQTSLSLPLSLPHHVSRPNCCRVSFIQFHLNWFRMCSATAAAAVRSSASTVRVGRKQRQHNKMVNWTSEHPRRAHESSLHPPPLFLSILYYYHYYILHLVFGHRRMNFTAKFIAVHTLWTRVTRHFDRPVSEWVRSNDHHHHQPPRQMGRSLWERERERESGVPHHNGIWPF